MEVDSDLVNAKIKLMLGEQALAIAHLQAGFEAASTRVEELSIELTQLKSAGIGGSDGS